MVRPGRLTTEHLAGRRSRYVRPVQLFLLINVLLFVAAPRMPMFSYSLENYQRFAPPSPELVREWVAAAEPARADSAARAEYAAAFDRRVENQRKGLIVLFAPAIALVLRGLFALRRREAGVPRIFGEHLVFAFHSLSFLWLILTGWGVLSRIARAMAEVTGGWGVAALVAILLVAAPTYVLLAIRRVYRVSWLMSVLATAALGVTFTALLVGYRTLLFFITYYSL
jgi:hypothetical protein